MFNYYINEKNIKEQKEDEERKEKQKIDEAKRKSKQITNHNFYHYILLRKNVKINKKL